ncbi:MAG: toll/interleukin-1 receptor domain-containing protein [Desulfobacterales bacterium]|nr:MAG: toll/interleukin-1 receptor domain-containing protein [Desulfobacterales bacterium]
MKIFLSYSSANRTKAEEIALALQTEGHEVFFDKEDLSGGEDFNAVIRTRIAGADLFVFLISPDSVRQGTYSLSELRLARERWTSPKKHVLPVLLEPTDMETIPAFLKGVTIFEPQGNAAAEIAAHLRRSARRSGPVLIAAAVAVLVTLAVLFYPPVRRFIGGGQEAFNRKDALSNFVNILVFPPNMIERTEYSLDPGSSFPPGRGDVVSLERVAFGRVSNDFNAFNIMVAVTNTTAQPILLDLTHRFFDLEDDQGRKSELLYFCCKASGESLGPGQQRQIQLLYRSPPGWEGKSLSAHMIYFRISGLLPLLRGSWSFRPLATAD